MVIWRRGDRDGYQLGDDVMETAVHGQICGDRLVAIVTVRASSWP